MFSFVKFAIEFRRFKKRSQSPGRFHVQWNDRYPCLKDKTQTTNFDSHYIYHPAWAARVLAITKPVLHIDVSSSLHFCSIVSAFVPVRFYDYRPAALKLSNLSSEAADLLALPFPDGSVSSLSCMHVVEHVGLGRYGDPLDPDGDLKAITELKRVVAADGSLLFVVPVGSPRIMFNAHRIYSYAQVISYFNDFNLEEFSLITDDARGIVQDATEELANQQSYGCGCFWFKKRKITAGSASIT